MIPKQTVQQVLEASRVEEVVGEFVQLKKRGVNQIGLCPFHNEKTPSFIVSPAKGIFKCFGCGEAGSSVDFVMKHEHYTFPQAVKWLAQKYNIEIEEEEQTPEQVQAENDRESLFAVTEFAAKFFKTAFIILTKARL
jgi:DNA primase